MNQRRSQERTGRAHNVVQTRSALKLSWYYTALISIVSSSERASKVMPTGLVFFPGELVGIGHVFTGMARLVALQSVQECSTPAKAAWLRSSESLRGLELR